jgi:hypothetical protein
MRSPSHSWVSLAAWFYIGPFVAIGVLALFVLGFGVLAVATHALAVLLKHVGI